MASASTVTVADSATLLTTGPTAVALRNAGPYAIAVGGSGVTFATGFPVLNQEVLPIPLELGLSEGLYGICETGNSSDVRVLKTTPL